MKKNKQVETIEQSVTKETPKLEFSPYCQSNCKICNSDHAEEIQDLIKKGHKYLEICAMMKKDYGFDISGASVSRHQSNFTKAFKEMVESVSYEKFDAEIETASKHLKDALFIRDAMLRKLFIHIENGTLPFTFSDFFKIHDLINDLRPGRLPGSDDIMAVFKRSRTFNVDQPSMFTNTPTSQSPDGESTPSEAECKNV